MQFKKIMHRGACLFFVAFGFVAPSQAVAEPILDFGAGATYEDNINGSPSDADKEGDFYTTLFASLGGYTRVVEGTYLFLRGDAATSVYGKYNDLNVTIGGISAGVYKSFNDMLSAQLSLKGKIKTFKDEPRDSRALGGAIELKQQVTPTLWIKEGYEYERNNADSDLFGYKGHLAGVWSGYLIDPKTMLNLGYSYLSRKYDDATGFRTTSHTISAGLVRELAKRVYATIGYDRQINDSNVSGSDHNNNIYTIGVTYSF